MAVIPDPRGISFERWTAQVYDTLPATMPMSAPESAWPAWAENSIAAFQTAGYQVPLPAGFPTWRAWAESFLLVYPNTGA